MWKRAFIILLSLNLLIFVAGVVWLTSFPKTTTKHGTSVSPVTGKAASVQIAVGQDAINTYLQYALSQQADIKQFLSYANIQFSTTWDCDAGIQLEDHVVPVQMVLSPTVSSGNLDLQVQSATVGGIPVPTGLLFLVLKHAPWPAWITLDAPNSTIDINFTARQAHPYSVRILNYSPQTQSLTMQVSIFPKGVMSATNG